MLYWWKAETKQRVGGGNELIVKVAVGRVAEQAVPCWRRVCFERSESLRTLGWLWEFCAFKDQVFLVEWNLRIGILVIVEGKHLRGYFDPRINSGKIDCI